MDRTITQDTIIKTRQHFAEIYRDSIAEVMNKTGQFYPNDPDGYVRDCQQKIVDSLAGAYDHTFTFQQRAWWLQTGECVPFLL